MIGLMFWAYVLALCIGDMFWPYYLALCFGDMFWPREVQILANQIKFIRIARVRAPFDNIIGISARTSPTMALLHTWLISEQEIFRPENLTSQFWRYFHALGGSDSSESDQNY